MDTIMWRELLEPYDLAVRELKVKFRHLIYEYRDRDQYSPIERVTGRVKTVSSILDKAQKKNIPLDELEERMTDLAGVRIVCQFVEDIQRVVEMIRARTDMEVVSERDYVTKMKESGYRSYHIIVNYQVQTVKGPRKIKVEIQVRTLAMNFWSTIEHPLAYKYKKDIPEDVSKKLSNVANAIISLDNEMSAARSEIVDAQNAYRAHVTTVDDIEDTIQNLSRVLSAGDMQKIQDAFSRIYAMDDAERLAAFSDRLDEIAAGYQVQSPEDF